MFRIISLLLVMINLTVINSIAQNVPEASVDTRLFPQFNNSIRPERFAGNWKVELTDKEGGEVFSGYIVNSPPSEVNCEKITEDSCKYYVEYQRDKEWDTAYWGSGNIYHQDIKIYSNRIDIQHSFGIGGNWGADSTVRFGGGVGTGAWNSNDRGEEGGTERWKRLKPTIERVEFFGIDVDNTVLFVSSVSVGRAGTVTGIYSPFDWSVENNAPGNRPSFFVNIYGDNLWGYHVFDVSDGIGLNPKQCNYISGETTEENLGIIGLRCEVLIWQGVTNGDKMLRLDNIEIPFDLIVDGLEDEIERFELVVGDPRLPVNPDGQSKSGSQKILSGSRGISFTTEVTNYGEVTAPSLLVDVSLINGRKDGMVVEYCDESGYECSPCDPNGGDGDEKQRFLCEGSNLEPLKKSFITVKVPENLMKVEKDKPWSRRAYSEIIADQCTESSEFSLSIYGYDESTIEEEDLTNNQATFAVSGNPPQIDNIELLGVPVKYSSLSYRMEPLENNSLYPLEALYPIGLFKIKLNFKEVICDKQQVSGLKIVADIVDGRTGSRRLKVLDATLSEDNKYLLSSVIAAGPEGTRYNFQAGTAKASATVEELPKGLFAVNAIDSYFNQRREIARGGKYITTLTISDVDVRNVHQVLLRKWIFEGDIEADDVNELVKKIPYAGDTWPIAIETRPYLGQWMYNIGDGKFIYESQVADIGDEELLAGANLAITVSPHAPVTPFMGLLKIVNDQSPEIEALVFKQDGKEVDKVKIGSPFSVGATLVKPIVTRKTLDLSLEVQAINEAQIGANIAQTKMLTLSATNNKLYSATFNTKEYSNGATENTLQGFDGDLLLATYGDIKVRASLSDESDKRSITIITTDGSGMTVDARGILSSLNNVGPDVEFVTNRAVKIDDKVSGMYKLTVEYPNCCEFTNTITISEDQPDDIVIPALASVHVTTDVLTDEQRVTSTITAMRDNYRSAIDQQLVKWRMLPQTGNFITSDVLSGLDLPPGTYDFRLIHPTSSFKMSEEIGIDSGRNTIEFNDDSSIKLTKEQAEESVDRASKRYQPLDEEEDFDGDGIPNEIDNKPREYSDVIFSKELGVTGKIIDRGNNKIVITGYGNGAIGIEVAPDNSENAKSVLIELLGIELELEPGTSITQEFN